MQGLNATIQRRLLSTGIAITIILTLLGIITYFNVNNTFEQYALLSRIEKLKLYDVELKNHENNFLLKETSNSKFYQTQKSLILDSLYKVLDNVEDELLFLKNQPIITDLNISQELNSVEQGFQEYKTNLNKLKELTIQKGFKDYGMVGQMREQIHAVESIIEEQNNLAYSKFMLTLRRHEKDYLLRKDLRYRDKFDKVIDDFIAILNKDKGAQNDKIINYLKQYQEKFHQVIKKDLMIGLKENSGLMKTINDNVNQIETNLSLIHNSIKKSAEKKIAQAVITLFSLIVLLSATILIFLYRDSKYIVTSIKKMKKYIARLGKGELPEEIKVSGTDEIEDMKKSINKLTANLKLTRDFVIEVGNGNFKKEINVFNGKGELGSNLINMRKKLLQVSSERELQAKENEQRMWHNEGIGLFSEILRTNNDNLEELSYMIVKNLVKYTKSNQGGIFIKNQHNNTKITYDLKAAYAYDRRKFADSNIALGEGLIGTCAIEAETIYMTDIPDNYIKITSGLGGANPNSLLIVPLKREEEVLGMIEIASFNKYQPYEIAFVEKIADSVASHLYFVQMNIKTNELLAKTQQQSEEMAAQEEEMRQNIEELQATQEESSRRAENFEQQIIELQKTNEKLEEQLEKAKATIKTFEKKSHKK
jgi:hypothetical protein